MNGIVNKLLKFSDDAKLVGIVSSPLEVNELQLYLQKMYSWLANVVQTDECKTLHFGYNNVNNEYMLGNEIIKSCDEESDLGLSSVILWRRAVNVLQLQNRPIEF